MDVYGLRSRAGGHDIPLKEIKVFANIRTFTAEVTLEQHYFNESRESLEVEYKFPLDDGSTIYHFEAFINGKTLTGKVEEKTKAEQTYSDAISAGKGAYMLSKEKEDLFSMSVGNLPPQQSVILKIGYVVELSVKNDYVIFNMVPNIFPSYNGTINFEAKLSMGFPIIEARAFPLGTTVPVSFANINDKRFGSISSHNALRFTNEQRVLHIQLAEPHQPSIFSEISPDARYRAFALHFFPSTPYVECESELVFVLDRSGSMSGKSIQQLQLTMYQVLKHLPSSSTFNIVGFGSNFEFLFPSAVACNPKYIRHARKHISTLKADLGGTHLMGPLQYIYKTTSTAQPRDGKPSRIIFVLTDGEVENKNNVASLIQSNQETTQVFSFGIGNSVDRLLVKQMAEFGRGAYTFISGHSEEEMEMEVLSLLHKAIQPSHAQVSLEWYTKQNGKIDSTLIQQAPFKLPPIFNKQLYTVYGLVENNVEMSHAVLTAIGRAGKQEFVLSFASQKEPNIGLLLHRLAAGTLIRELEEKSTTLPQSDKQKIIDLSVQFNIASTYASFVIVEDRTLPVMETMKLVQLEAPKPPQPSYVLSSSPSPSYSYSSYSKSSGQDSVRYAAILAQVDECKGIMHNNIDVMMRNHSFVEGIQSKTETMRSNASQFRQRAGVLKRRMFLRKLIPIIVIVAVILLIVFILLMVFLVN